MTDPKWGGSHQSALVEEYHTHVRRIIAERTKELGGSWADLVVDRSLDLLTPQDLIALEQTKLSSGYRFDAAATVSVRESSDKYKPIGGDLEPDAPVGAVLGEGEPIAVGDNVRQGKDFEGVVLRIRTLEQVFSLLTDGVPPNSVALIDDSGGTLTAPVLKDLTALLCLGGTVRSHLAILSREYGLPCLMNVELAAALETGDRVRVEYSAPAMTAAAYDAGGGVRANVWKLDGAAAAGTE